LISGRRLFRVLRIDDGKQQSRVRTAHRKHAEELWDGLNEWLSAANGRLGLPTAPASRAAAEQTSGEMAAGLRCLVSV
jgi:hypothetical protein